MNISNNTKNIFKNAISEYFYDKTIEIYAETTDIDDEGSEVVGAVQLINDNVKCNIQINNNELNLKDYGFEIDADYKISMHYNANLGDLIKYNDKYYKLIKILEFDNYNMCYGVL